MVASSRLVTLVAAALLGAALPSPTSAKSWCAYPLHVHEWGVHVFGGDGAARAESGLLPTWFAGPGKTLAAAPRVPVRTLPADSGVRDLPVVHFYSPRGASATIPVGLEVGFTQGLASTWYPDVDLLRPRGAAPQLVWERLDLGPAPALTPAATDVPWIREARALDALWVQAPGASERFVFYEATTSERVPLALRRGATWGPGRRHLELHNTGRHAVHDLLVVHREGSTVFVFDAATIPAGKSAGFVLDDHAPRDVRAATRGALVDALVDHASPVAPTTYRWDHDRCVMMRDPAVPVTKADGHRLYRAEVDLLLGVWGERLFDRPGTTIVYREDAAYLDEVMPLAVYTDMYNYVVLRRAGLAVWSDVPLP
ncbi:MAG: hypothetical protein IT385_14970 [Deltaproteobacteria bacterium]|nr:hypothetical protein [Deltaproteobacteria bacterium]